MDDGMTVAEGQVLLRKVNIVVMSDRLSEKASATDIILGCDASPSNRITYQHVRRQGEVAGRQVALADVQAWKYSRPFTQKTPQTFKQEMIRGVASYAQGPHALLLVVHDDVIFSEGLRDAIFEHVTVLGEDIWNFAIVVFMVGNKPSDIAELSAAAEGRSTFEVKGRMLQSLVEKCGGRYHILNVDSCKNNANKKQVRELLEKIDLMVAGNEGRCLELDRQLWVSQEKQRRAQLQRATERQRAVQIQRQAWQELKGDTTLSAIDILLLGPKGYGKSSSGNSILGREEFKPGKTSCVCVKKRGVIEGRHVTVVEGPGWHGTCPPECASQAVNLQIMVSHTQCDSGKPHAILFVLRPDECFDDDFRRTLEESLYYLEESAWSRAMVLFTFGDRLGNTTIEQHIESEGESLQWLVDKCSNRYHVFNNCRQSRAQVRELLQKIEEMLASNGDLQYEVDHEFMGRMLARRNQQDRDAEAMTNQMTRKKEARQKATAVPRLSDMRLMLLGFRFSGKSSTGNTILGRQAFELCSNPSGVTAEGEVAGRRISIVEPPAASSTNANLYETARLLIECLTSPGPHALLLMVRIDMGFDEISRQVTEEYVDVLGEQVWNHIIVVFTYGDWLGDTTSVEEHIMREDEALRRFVEQCGNRYHLMNNSCDVEDQVVELLEKVEEMVMANGGTPFECDPNTSGLARWGDCD